MGNRDNYLYGVGLDVGTAFCVTARKLQSKQIEFLSQRDAFLELEPVSELNAKMIKASLDKKGAFYLNKDGKFYIVGQHAIDTASDMRLNVDRPLKQGVLSVKDKESFGMLSKILEVLVGEPLVYQEKCVYSYPSDPVDATFDAILHQKIVGSILTNLGYNAVPILEGEALAYSELADDGWTGMAISFGAGQTNICLMYMGTNVLSFSIARGGDFIDAKVSEKLDRPDTIIQIEKESGINLFEPQGSIQQAISFYYDHLIEYVTKHLVKKLKNTRDIPVFKDPIKIVISGGTSLPEGFIEKFKERLKIDNFEKELNLTIGEVKHATDPLTAVANGCLVASEV